MTTGSGAAAPPTKIMQVYDLLLQHYGERPLKARRPPMVELIMTMLSHRTTAKNERMAFERLWARFPSWEAIRDAPTAAVAEAISPANFAEAKAPRIQAVLTQIIRERGSASIDFLADLPPAEGLAWLTALPGVGVKTATLVLLFCFAKPLLPVDTHVHRISGRLGLIGPKVSAEKAHDLLLAMLPPDPHTLYNFHITMLRHGQQLCTWRNPRCERCPLRPLCDYYQAQRAGQQAE